MLASKVHTDTNLCMVGTLVTSTLFPHSYTYILVFIYDLQGQHITYILVKYYTNILTFRLTKFGTDISDIRLLQFVNTQIMDKKGIKSGLVNIPHSAFILSYYNTYWSFCNSNHFAPETEIRKFAM
jgi:hypothetical protein